MITSTGNSPYNYLYMQSVMMHLNQLHPQAGAMAQPSPQPSPAPGPAPVGPTPGPAPLPPGALTPRVTPGSELTPEERAGAVPSAETLENLAMARNYQDDYQAAANSDGTGDTSQQDGDGGLSSPSFYASMAKDARAMTVVDAAQAAIIDPNDPTRRLRPEPGPQPGPGPQPPAPPSGPIPVTPANLVPGSRLTPEERAGAVPTAESLENLEMARNYQDDYEAASNSDGTDSGTQDDNGGLSSPSFYADMAKDGRALNVVEAAQEAIIDPNNPVAPQPGPGPRPPPGPQPGPGPEPAPGPRPGPGPQPGPIPVNPENLVPGSGMTPYERAGAVPSAMTLENLAMARNYQDDYQAASNSDGTDSGTQDADGGLSSPSFYADMVKDGRALNVVEAAQEAIIDPNNPVAPQPGPGPQPGPRPNPYDPLYEANAAAVNGGTGGQAPKEITAAEFSQNMNGDARAAGVTDWMRESLQNHDSAMTIRTQFQFERGATQMFGMANGLPLPSNFMASQQYLSAAGTANTLPTASDPNGFFGGLKNFLSPENAASRTLDFAVGTFPLSSAYSQGGDTADSRQEYASGLSKLSDLAYSQVTGHAGDLPQEARDALGQTRDLLSQGLNTFVQSGASPAKDAAGGIYDQLREYALSQRTNHEPMQEAGNINPAVSGIGFSYHLDQQV